MSTYIDINCDMGESYGRWTLGNDEGVMPHITSANIACGFHGGEPHVMRKTVELALKHGVAIGAHPGLPDLMGFGRRRMEVSPQEIKDIHRYQVGALGAFVHAAGSRLQHVKAHGIQYHMFEENLELGRASAEQVLELDPNLILMVMAMTKYDAEARKTKVRVAAEGFALEPGVVPRRTCGDLVLQVGKLVERRRWSPSRRHSDHKGQRDAAVSHDEQARRT